MGKSIKTETTAELYMAEVIGPKIESIEESLDSLKDDQATVLNTIKEDNANLLAKFEEMRSTKAQGRQFIFCNKENLDSSIRESINSILNDNLIQRTINVQTTSSVRIDRNDAEQIKAQITALREWTKSNKEKQAAYEKCRRPLIHITFTKKWFLAVIITILISSLSAVGYILYNIRQTAESWADRSYKAGLELNEENPGFSYHEIIQDFQNGYDVEARQKVTNREIAGKARMKKIHHYEKSLNAYLQNVEPHGVHRKLNQTIYGKEMIFSHNRLQRHLQFFPHSLFGIGTQVQTVVFYNQPSLFLLAKEFNELTECQNFADSALNQNK